ncbi:MAG: glycosyltransferase family 4 protein [Coleofasciculus chthonoplastes F3-SA18-01]|uniref:glycosyltransferase family 4 protein n=1 Tax=Coleofasciculus chthonoplastes TaxID=64178 RepID=UPI0032F6B61A
MPKPLRVLYAAGPGNVISTYNQWLKQEDDPSQVSVTYSAQFYDVCRALEAEAYIISWCKERARIQDGQFTIEHRPLTLRRMSGFPYHLGQLWYGLRLIASAVRFQANVAVVSDGTTYWFLLSLLPWLGVQVIPSLHCVLWRKYISPSRVERLMLSLSRPLFAKYSTAILAVSDEIADQVKQITGGENRPILRSFPVYRREQFEGIDEPDEKRSPFRVLFVGRITREKGVFDLLEIAQGFAAKGRADIKFDICGGGMGFDSLRLAAKEAEIESSFVCHGHCKKPQMRDMFSKSHVVIVPTRTNFVEGFNKVVVEGILAGRPVVASAVCTDLSYLQDAVVEVQPDDIKGYGDALLKLCHDREFYDQKRQGCLELQEQFYDSSRGWGAKLKSMLVAIQERQEVGGVLEGKVNHEA